MTYARNYENGSCHHKAVFIGSSPIVFNNVLVYTTQQGSDDCPCINKIRETLIIRAMYKLSKREVGPWHKH